MYLCRRRKKSGMINTHEFPAMGGTLKKENHHHDAYLRPPFAGLYTYIPWSLVYSYVAKRY